MSREEEELLTAFRRLSDEDRASFVRIIRIHANKYEPKQVPLRLIPGGREAPSAVR